MPTITFKVSEAEARELRRIARLRNTTVSNYLRLSAFPQRNMHADLEDKLCPGRVIISRAADAPLLTSEMVAAALYEQ